MALCYLGIGSNLGNRLNNIRSAIRNIDQLKGTKVLKVSRIIETNPLGGPKAQGKFLNAALRIETRILPLQLLRELKKIESNLGRAKTVRNGPRTIDLDILFYADKIVNRKGLKIPHPRVFEREFVVKPLLEVL
ncbi:MAG: 2-amino-4-hydroxy-6-hydroxymethyldihydropteridine diphosphokinase [Candidatus Omnitrophica bacterium]|nr:2-amino-4-hydroxy-6-hydroxymethyldihydropteridine diphosphokinase [Candidatus Omnitrophota bacterium]